MKKIIALLIAFVMVFSLGACGSEQKRDGDVIYLDFEIVDNGYGYAWLDAACAEFMQLVADKDYDGEGGKKPGVVCNVNVVDQAVATKEQNMASSGMHVFFVGGVAEDLIINSNSQVLDLTELMLENNYNNGKTIEQVILDSDYDVVTKVGDAYTHSKTGTSIADLLYSKENSVNAVMIDGEPRYYTIPTHQVLGGMTYDKDLFDKYGLYFANPDSEKYYTFDSTLTGVEVKFVRPRTTDWQLKSVGPDGVGNTYDDGMPSSLIELIQLYEFMSTEKGIYPLQIPGDLLYELDFAVDGLYTALLGVDRARELYDFSGKTDIDIVTSLVTTEDAFKIDNKTILKEKGFAPSMPYVENIKVSEGSGYYTTWSVERYYTLLFFELCLRQGWFAPGSSPSEKYRNKDAQFNFICSDYDDGTGSSDRKIGTMSTGSYWYNESLNQHKNFRTFEYINPGVERNLLWMPLPVNIFTSVTGVQEDYDEEDYLVETFIGTTESTKGETQALCQAHINGMCVNKNVLQEPETYAALKDWIRFFHSQKMLEKTTIRQGMRRALNYNVPDINTITDPVYKAELQNIMNESKWMKWDSDGKPWSGFYKQLSDYIDSPYAEVIKFDSSCQSFIKHADLFDRGEYSTVCSPDGESFLKQFYVKGFDHYNAMIAFEGTMIDFDVWDGMDENVAVKVKNAKGSDIVYNSYQGTIPN